jgi:hypothetical protein
VDGTGTGVQRVAERGTCVKAALSHYEYCQRRVLCRGKWMRSDGRMMQLVYKVLCNCSLLNIVPSVSISHSAFSIVSRL